MDHQNCCCKVSVDYSARVFGYSVLSLFYKSWCHVLGCLPPNRSIVNHDRSRRTSVVLPTPFLFDRVTPLPSLRRTGGLAGKTRVPMIRFRLPRRVSPRITRMIDMKQVVGAKNM